MNHVNPSLTSTNTNLTQCILLSNFRHLNLCVCVLYCIIFSKYNTLHHRSYDRTHSTKILQTPGINRGLRDRMSMDVYGIKKCKEQQFSTFLNMLFPKRTWCHAKQLTSLVLNFSGAKMSQTRAKQPNTTSWQWASNTADKDPSVKIGIFHPGRRPRRSITL